MFECMIFYILYLLIMYFLVLQIYNLYIIKIKCFSESQTWTEFCWAWFTSHHLFHSFFGVFIGIQCLRNFICIRLRCTLDNNNIVFKIFWRIREGVYHYIYLWGKLATRSVKMLISVNVSGNHVEVA